MKKIPRDRMATRAKIYCGTIVEEQGKILLVLEEDEKYPGYDLPGGKLLWCENVKDCAIREFVEETGYKITLKNLLGVYQRANVVDESDYFRFIFVGKIKPKEFKKEIDEKVVKVKWVKVGEIIDQKIKLRSNEVYREILDCVNKKQVSVEVVGEYVW